MMEHEFLDIAGLKKRIDELEAEIKELQELPLILAEKIHDSAIAGATGTGLYMDGAAAETWGPIAADVLEGLMESIIPPIEGKG